MKHIVTLSLVFFSLAHLNQAERVQGLRILTERYCKEQQAHVDNPVAADDQCHSEHSPFLLSYNELTLIGTIPANPRLKHTDPDQLFADLVIREKPKNNSP